MERRCLDCGESLRGRSDKKFCSDQCRNNYNNRLNRDETTFIRNVQNVLRRNRRILTELNPEGNAKIHRDKLIAKGYNFDFFTNNYTTKTGRIYYFCFEQGYFPGENGYLELVKREEDF